jgi:hypothetical protein
MATVSSGPDVLRRLPRSPLISKPQSAGVIAVFGVLLVMAPLWSDSQFWKGPAKGLLVHTSGRTRSAAGYDPWLKPLVLRIDAKNRWFLDGEPVTPEELPGVLKKALSRRPDWSVYLEADPGLEFGVPAQAMDVLQRMQVKVVVVDPGSR